MKQRAGLRVLRAAAGHGLRRRGVVGRGFAPSDGEGADLSVGRRRRCTVNHDGYAEAKCGLCICLPVSWLHMAVLIE